MCNKQLSPLHVFLDFFVYTWTHLFLYLLFNCRVFSFGAYCIFLGADFIQVHGIGWFCEIVIGWVHFKRNPEPRKRCPKVTVLFNLNTSIRAGARANYAIQMLEKNGWIEHVYVRCCSQGRYRTIVGKWLHASFGELTVFGKSPKVKTRQEFVLCYAHALAIGMSPTRTIRQI